MMELNAATFQMLIDKLSVECPHGCGQQVRLSLTDELWEQLELFVDQFAGRFCNHTE